MNALKLAKIFPCVALFADGRPVAGVTAFLLQATIVFWPVASRWAYVSHERSGIERLLGELSETNRLAVDPYERTPEEVPPARLSEPLAEPDAAAAFILANTIMGASVLQPGLKLYLADEITPLWLATEDFLQQNNMAPPFWAFAWPGGEALAHYIAAEPELVRGKTVLDFAAGGGIAALACAAAGAARVEAAEIDPFAVAAIRLNAAANQLTLHPLLGDIVGAECRWDIILCGDVCYEAAMTRHIMPWLQSCAAKIPVIMADPGRRYAPKEGFDIIYEIEVPTRRELEDSAARAVRLLRLVPGAPAPRRGGQK